MSYQGNGAIHYGVVIVYMYKYGHKGGSLLLVLRLTP